ncbi:hypothetical protein CspHIS471_0104330 [Cutaneotrichosporon sp. HIS471]|nr:hypothetical protein CspHIS471_0104330 [Cutaneotrichosporon sp. HIS471]
MATFLAGPVTPGVHWPTAGYRPTHGSKGSNDSLGSTNAAVDTAHDVPSVTDSNSDDGLANLVTTESERVEPIDPIISFSPILEAFRGSEPKDAGMKFKSEAGGDNATPAKRLRDEDEEDGTRPTKVLANAIQATIKIEPIEIVFKSEAMGATTAGPFHGANSEDNLKAEIKVEPSQELHEMTNPEEKAIFETRKTAVKVEAGL